MSVPPGTTLELIVRLVTLDAPHAPAVTVRSAGGGVLLVVTSGTDAVQVLMAPDRAQHISDALRAAASREPFAEWPPAGHA